jgi:GNAT superfamily N-acetyltransferase
MYPVSTRGGPMQTRKITKADFDQIVEVIDRWWGGPIATLAHPIFYYELGDNALIVEQEGRLVGFLLGFIVFKAPKTGYVHLVGIHPDYRRQGVGRLLYKDFTERCASLGCLRMKAITTHGNEGSIRFHQALGWNAEEVADYAGPDRKRLVFTKSLMDLDADLQTRH